MPSIYFPNIYLVVTIYQASVLNGTGGKQLKILIPRLPRTHGLGLRHALQRKEELEFCVALQDHFATQTWPVRVRKHRKEMIYSCGEGVGREIDAEEE